MPQETRCVFTRSLLGSMVVVALAGWGWVCQGQEARPKESTITVITEDLEVQRLRDDVWRHISYQYLETFGRSPANGLVVVAGDEAVLLDTPWTESQTAALFDWVSKELNARITTVVATHSHPDNLGGLGEAHRRGANSFAFERTVQSARQSGREVPRTAVPASYDLEVGSQRLELRFFGGGHTSDNIVVWIPSEKILFGGCLVRSATATTLGFTREADLEGWPRTIERLLEQYGSQDPLVVPGHGAPGGNELLRHTLDLLNKR